MSSFISNSSSTSSTNDICCTPLVGWLTKMISLPFGRSRWISRYFVLLDSELRFYKDEHSDSASQILNLKKICQAIPAPTTQRPFCFRLEPQRNENSIRPWIIECKSESDMEAWIAAIQNRIMKYNNNSVNSTSHTSSAASLLLPKQTLVPVISTSTIVRVVSTYSITNNASPEIYRTPTLPLRCTNLTSSDDEEAKESLLIRRNKKLAPIATSHTQQPSIEEEEEAAPQTSFSTSTSCSSTLPSPTGAVLGPLISPGIIDRYNQYKSSLPSLIITTKGALYQQQQQGQSDEKEEDEQLSSPTYLMYKKIFHL